jgi:hypothetical protein
LDCGAAASLHACDSWEAGLELAESYMQAGKVGRWDSAMQPWTTKSCQRISASSAVPEGEASKAAGFDLNAQLVWLLRTLCSMTER